MGKKPKSALFLRKKSKKLQFCYVYERFCDIMDTECEEFCEDVLRLCVYSCVKRGS